MDAGAVLFIHSAARQEDDAALAGTAGESSKDEAQAGGGKASAAKGETDTEAKAAKK